MAKSATEDRPRWGARLRRRLRLAGILAAIAAGAFFLGGIFGHQPSQPEITTDLIGQQLADIQELATVEYFYTNMGRFENCLDFYGWAVPLTRLPLPSPRRRSSPMRFRKRASKFLTKPTTNSILFRSAIIPVLPATKKRRWRPAL